MFDNGATASLNIFTDPQTGGQTINAGNNDVIYYPDSVADSVYYIHRGQVRLYSVKSRDTSRLVEILGPGQWFGAASLAGQKTHQMRAVAVAGVVLTQVRTERLLASLANNPTQYAELTRQLAFKLMAQTDEASRLVFEDCNHRLISALLKFSQSAASTQREDGVVLRITHDQLAQAVGVARETVSLALTQLRQQNLLRTGRNQLMFNPESLKRFATTMGNDAAPMAQLAHAVESAA